MKNKFLHLTFHYLNLNSVNFVKFTGRLVLVSFEKDR